MVYNIMLELSCKVNVSLKEVKEYKLRLIILFMQFSDIFNLRKIIGIASPSLPIFIFGYALILKNSIFNWVFFIISMFLTSLYFILEEDEIVKKMFILLIDNSNNKIKVAKEIGQSKFIPFLLKGVICVITFGWRIFAMIITIIFMVKYPDIVWAIFLIISIVGFFYTILWVIIKNKKISNSVKLIKGKKV